SVVESAFKDGRLQLWSAARAIAPMAPYLADTGSTIVIRLRRGETLTAAHREHAYQRIVQLTGWDHWMVSLLVSLASIGCGVASRSRQGSLLIAPIVASYLLMPRGLGILRRPAGGAPVSADMTDYTMACDNSHS